MWETQIVCKACEKTHLLCAKLIPRTFVFECPETQERVDMSFRDPSRMPGEWTEVARRSPEAVAVLLAEQHGKYEL
jgi:hypothetical protein